MIKAIVIDDENRTRDLIVKMINSFGFEIEATAGGDNVKNGIESIEREKPDLVFLDIQMPEVSGLELAASLHSSLQFVFCTAFNSFALDAFALNALDYLVMLWRALRM